MGKKLPALDERTATARSDLMLINSGGADFKETKENFLADVYSSIDTVNGNLRNSFACDEIFRKLGIPTTATAYDCNWQNYNFLIISALQYGNIRASIILPYVEFYATSSGRRPQITDSYQGSIFYDIYQNGSGSIYVRSNATDSTLGISIYGVGRR